MRTSPKMSVKEIKESTGTWKILDDVLKKIKKLKPGKVPSLPEMEHLLKELRKGKRKGGSVSRKRGGGIGLTKKDVETRKPTPTLTKDEQLENKKLRELHKRGRALHFRLNKPSSTTKSKRNIEMSKGIGLTKKDVEAAKRKRKRTPAMGVTPKDVKQAKKKRTSSAGQRRRAAHQMADVEKGVTKDVRRGKKYSDIAKTISETGGLRGKIARGALALQGGMGDTTYKEAIKRGKAQGAKARKEARTATDRSGKEHMDPYGLIRKSITGGNRKGGTVKRKRGGKIMVGYKAGGKV